MFGIGKVAGQAGGELAKGVIEGVGNVLDDLFTSDEERGKVKAALESIAQAPFLASLKVLEVEANHSSIFVAGARPALLWGCVSGIVYEGFLRGIMQWVTDVIVILTGIPALPSLPSVENVFGELCFLAATLYGARGLEKWKGVARNNIGQK